MDNIYKFLLFGGMIGPYTMSIEELYYLNKEEVRDISIGLMLEMRELKNKGYTMDEILKLIEECFPLKDFKSDESDFFKERRDKKFKNNI